MDVSFLREYKNWYMNWDFHASFKTNVELSMQPCQNTCNWNYLGLNSIYFSLQ